MLSPTMAPTAATTMTSSMLKSPLCASTPAVMSAVSPGSGTPADSRGASPHLSGFIDPLLTERNRSIVEAVSRAADGLGWTPLEVALAWVRDRPGVTAPIVGARTAAHLKGSLSVEECELPTEITEALDDVSGDAAGEVP